jgi:hypothetical protein
MQDIFTVGKEHENILQYKRISPIVLRDHYDRH